MSTLLASGRESAPKRPAFPYHGSKFALSSWIIERLPSHETYVEPYGGACSVLLQKPRSKVEVYNDLDSLVVNVFKVLREDQDFLRKLEWTPFSREEFLKARQRSNDPSEQARRTIVRAYMGHGSAANHDMGTGFKIKSDCASWLEAPENLSRVAERMRGVVIENRKAIEVMRCFDSPNTLHYVDPPYVHSTRMPSNPWCKKGKYRFELDDSAHIELADCLHSLKGMVVLSGYACPLYDELFKGWHIESKSTYTQRTLKRTEFLWMNRAAKTRACR